METLKGFVLAILVMAVVTCAIAPGQVKESTTHDILTTENIECP